MAVCDRSHGAHHFPHHSCIGNLKTSTLVFAFGFQSERAFDCSSPTHYLILMRMMMGLAVVDSRVVLGTGRASVRTLGLGYELIHLECDQKFAVDKLAHYESHGKTRE